uniref:Uncharacterized protein n=1 Tax=Heterorhabditis bacteriophora TaxID=37862 RepID=A0A1I7WJH4_HETBA
MIYRERITLDLTFKTSSFRWFFFLTFLYLFTDLLDLFKSIKYFRMNMKIYQLLKTANVEAVLNNIVQDRQAFKFLIQKSSLLIWLLYIKSIMIYVKKF